MYYSGRQGAHFNTFLRVKMCAFNAKIEICLFLRKRKFPGVIAFELAFSQKIFF
jgi:hypothetical protein